MAGAVKAGEEKEGRAGALKEGSEDDRDEGREKDELGSYTN